MCRLRSTKDFIKDGLMLTVTALLLRSAGVYFSARLSIIAGAAVMGLYTQIMTVYSFAVTAASAGINLGAMRLTSECHGSGDVEGIRKGVAVCVRYCLSAGIVVGTVTFLFAPFLGGVILNENDSIISLRALSFALPFIALSNALHGFFNGIKQIPKSAFTSLFEQFFRISATIIALQTFAGASREMLCLILVICNASSEAASCLILSVFYYFERKKYPISKSGLNNLKKRFIGITVPIAVSSLIRSALTTTEHILIPIGLRVSGLSGENALAEYGIMSGMVLPVLLYPMALLSSFASITIAEISSRVSAGEGRETLRRTVAKGIRFALIYGIGCTAIIGFFSEKLGLSIYKSTEAGYFIRIMAPLIIFMYLDHIADGMLKGLDKQNYVMRVNIIDAALSVIFAALLIPKLGIYGFAASLYLCEIMNCCFSFGKLFIIMKPDIGIMKAFILPCASALISTHVFAYIGNGAPLIPSMITSNVIYLILLKICGSLNVFTESFDKAHTPNKASTRLKTETTSRL